MKIEIFTPSKEVKDELQSTKIAITCYDKDGNIVKRVTSADTNDVEDPDSLTPDPSPTGEGSGNNSGGGSGSNTGGGGNTGGGDNPGGGDDDNPADTGD